MLFDRFDISFSDILINAFISFSDPPVRPRSRRIAALDLCQNDLVFVQWCRGIHTGVILVFPTPHHTDQQHPDKQSSYDSTFSSTL